VAIVGLHRSTGAMNALNAEASAAVINCRRYSVGDTLIADGLLPLQNVASHVSGADAELNHVRVGHMRAVDLIQDRIEELKTRLSWDEAVSPAANERRVMELVLGTDEPGHWQTFPIYSLTRAQHLRKSARSRPTHQLLFSEAPPATCRSFFSAPCDCAPWAPLTELHEMRPGHPPMPTLAPPL
jgi:hypothetical protein